MPKNSDAAIQRSFGLDLARALAIVTVLAAHFVKRFEDFGFWGVELFFGLSGFLIGQILWRNYTEAGVWSFKHMLNFWSRRWWRTLPNYYLFLIIMLFYSYYVGSGLPSLPVFLKHLWFGQNLLSRENGFFGVAWSLCIEEYFYLLFPLILFIISRFTANPKFAYISALVLIFVIAAVVREVLYSQQAGSSIRGITLARIDAIGCGVLVSFWLSVTEVTNSKRWMAFFLGVLLFLFACVSQYYIATHYDPMIVNRYLLVIIALGFSLMLPVISLLPRPQGIFNTFSKWVDNLSFWSYSIYLSHIPVLFTIYKLVQHKMLSKVLGLIVTIIISSLIFKYFEVPMTRKRPKEITA